MPKKADKAACPKCGRSGGLYFKKDGSIRCAKCNYEGSLEGDKK